MIDMDGIRPLTEFKRHTPECIAELKRTGKAQILTVNGRAEVVVQDAMAYQHLLEALDRAVAIAGIRAGLADFARGDVVGLDEAIDLARKAIANR